MKENFFLYTTGPLPHIHLGSFHIPTYYFVTSLTACVSILWFYKRCEKFRLSKKKAMDLCLVLLMAGFIGARLFHIFFEGFSHYLAQPEEIFYFWQGGFVFYGGALTAYLAVFIFIKKSKLDFWLWHDVLAPVLALSYSLGRLACLFVGCCYGKVCALPWAFPLKQWNPESQKTEILLRHPTALYASSLEFLILCFLLFLEKKKTIFGQKPKAGQLFLFWVLLHSVNRIIMEIFRDDPRGGNFYGLSLSTLISIFLFLISFSIIIKKFLKTTE